MTTQQRLHTHQEHDPHREKQLVALSSVGAALGLTSIKLLAGILTGSLGILAEAAHSGLDLIAALMTLFAVRVSSRPADETHHNRHEKFENLSAFLEALLLLATAGWVIGEAVQRLLTHKGHVEISLWAFLVMGVSILVDMARSCVLLRVACKGSFPCLSKSQVRLGCTGSSGCWEVSTKNTLDIHPSLRISTYAGDVGLDKDSGRYCSLSTVAHPVQLFNSEILALQAGNVFGGRTFNISQLS